MFKNNHLIALLIFVILTCTYFSPLIFEGKKLNQNDVYTHKGISKEIVDFRKWKKEEALWTTSLFGGMPSYLISTIFPKNLINYVYKFFHFNIRPASFLLWYMMGFYLLLIVLGVNPWISIVGAIGFGFSTYFLIIIEAGHNSKAEAIAYLSPVIASIIYTFRKKTFLGFALTSLFMALELRANHPQITYYMFIIIAVFWIFELVDNYKNRTLIHFAKKTSLIAIAILLAIGTHFAYLSLTYEYSKYSTRGKTELTFNKDVQTGGLDKDYATQWSYGIGETFTLMIPNFKGGVSEPIQANKSRLKTALKNVPANFRRNVAMSSSYWGNQPFTSGPVYAGAILCFLFVLGLFIIKEKIKWWLMILTIISILLAWGKNMMWLTDLAFSVLPFYNKFRAVSTILIIAEFTIPLLAIITLNNIIKNPEILNKNKKQFLISYALTGALSLLMYISPNTFNSFISKQEYSIYQQQMKQSPEYANYINQFLDVLQTARISIFKSDLFRTFILITISAIVLWLFSKKKIKENILIVLMSLLILFDMWTVNKRYLNNDDFINVKEFEYPFKETKADRQILSIEFPNNNKAKKIFEELKNIKEKENGRLSNKDMLYLKYSALRFSSHYRVFNTTAKGGPFNDASTSYFHKSIGGYHGAKMKRFQELIDYHISKNNLKVLDMLNTKYFIVNDNDNKAVAQLNTNALGNAWFVNNIKWVNNADEEILALNDFNPKKDAIIDKRFKNLLSGFEPSQLDSSSKISLLEYLPNYLKYKSITNKKSLAIFSEIYYPNGWNAYIDGKKTEYFRVNYILRAMLVPPGEHIIEFKFHPDLYFKGENVELVSSSIVLLLVVLSIVFYFKKKINNFANLKCKINFNVKKR